MPRKRSRYPGGSDSKKQVPLFGHTIYQHFWKDPNNKDKGLIWVGVRSEIAKVLGFSGDTDIPAVSTTKSGRRVLTCSVRRHVVQASGKNWIAIYPDKTEYPFKASPLATRKMMAQIASRWKNPPIALQPPQSSAFNIADILSEGISHVYLVQLQSFYKNKRGEAYYKIGKAVHIPRRIKQFGPCKVIASAAFPSESESLRAEAMIHNMYTESRQPGTEIFCFTDDQVEIVSKSLFTVRDGGIILGDKASQAKNNGDSTAGMKIRDLNEDQELNANRKGGTHWRMYWKDPEATHKGCIWIMFDGTVGTLFGITGDRDIPSMRTGLRISAAKSKGKNWFAYHEDGSKYSFKASPMATKKIMSQIALRWLHPPARLQPSDGLVFRLDDLKDETYSYVYAVKLATFSESSYDEYYIKIGKSNEIPRRIKQFGPCELVASIQLDTDKDALKAEKTLHKLFRSLRCPDTEIFRFGRSQIKELLEALTSLNLASLA